MSGLVLKRKVGDVVQVGDYLEIMVLEVREGSVKLRFVGPRDLPIFRQEVFQRMQDEKARADAQQGPA